MIKVLKWLAGTQLGRWAFGAAFVVAALLRVYFAGRLSAKRDRQRQSINALKKKNEVNHEVNQMDADDFDREFNKWMRD